MAKPKKPSIATFGDIKYYLDDAGQLVDANGVPAPPRVVQMLIKEGALTAQHSAADVGAAIKPSFARALNMNITPPSQPLVQPMQASGSFSAVQSASAKASTDQLKEIEKNTKQTNTLLQKLITQNARQFEEQNEILRRGLLNDQLKDGKDALAGGSRQAMIGNLFGKSGSVGALPGNPPPTPEPGGFPWGAIGGFAGGAAGALGLKKVYDKIRGRGNRPATATPKNTPKPTTTPEGAPKPETAPKGKPRGFGAAAKKGGKWTSILLALTAAYEGASWLAGLGQSDNKEEYIDGAIDSVIETVKGITDSIMNAVTAVTEADPAVLAAGGALAAGAAAAGLGTSLARPNGAPIPDPETKPPAPKQGPRTSVPSVGESERGRTAAENKAAKNTAAITGGESERGRGASANKTATVAQQNAETRALRKSIGKRLTSAVGKKMIPGIGLYFSGKAVYDDLMTGDYTGAAINAAAGGVSLLGPKGWIAGTAMMVGDIARESYLETHGRYPTLAELPDLKDQVYNMVKEKFGQQIQKFADSLLATPTTGELNNLSESQGIVDSADTSIPTTTPEHTTGGRIENPPVAPGTITGEQAPDVTTPAAPLTAGQEKFKQRIAPQPSKNVAPVQTKSAKPISGGGQAGGGTTIIKQGDTTHHHHGGKTGGKDSAGPITTSPPRNRWDETMWGMTRFD